MSDIMQVELNKQGQKWPMVSIKSVSTVVTGKTPSKKEADNFGGNIPFVTPVELGKEPYVYSSSQTITEKGAKAIKLVPKNSVLVCCIGSLGKTAIAGCEVGTNQQINSVIFDEGKVFPKYGYYALNRLKSLMVSLAPSTTVAIINKSNFEALEIPLPPLEEQKRIAAILDKADAIRRKRQQAIDLADDFLRAIFLDMFGDPVTNPKGWEVKSLRDISRIQIGPFGTQLHKEDYVQGGIPLINPTHIVKGKIVPKNDLTITVEKHGSLPEYHLNTGDIIMGRRGEMGRCAVVCENEKGWLCGTGSLYIRPIKSGVFSEYLNKLLSSDAIKNHLESESQGATMPNLNKTIIGNIQVPVPSDESLHQFAAIKKKIVNTKAFYSDFAGESVFESLSQKAFTGEL